MEKEKAYLSGRRLLKKDSGLQPKWGEMGPSFLVGFSCVSGDMKSEAISLRYPVYAVKDK